MDKIEYAVERIRNCDFCGGTGSLFWANGEDFDFETCEECNPHEIIFDYDGHIVWDNGTLFTTQEAK